MRQAEYNAIVASIAEDAEGDEFRLNLRLSNGDRLADYAPARLIVPNVLELWADDKPPFFVPLSSIVAIELSAG